MKNLSSSSHYLGFITTLLFSIALISISAMVFFVRNLYLESQAEISMQKMFYALLVFVSLQAHAKEYLYPVATCTTPSGASRFFLIYQKSPQHLELWSWDPATNLAAKALSSTFIPAGLQMEPDNSGFSFIDNGRIRIKKFNQRSPKTLEMYEPIHTIGTVTWAYPGIAYFHAKERDRFKIFQISDQSDLTCLVSGNGSDCMYPCIIDDQLFYIERQPTRSPDQELFHLVPQQSERFTYSIKCIPYVRRRYDAAPSFNDDVLAQERVKAILCGEDQIHGLMHQSGCAAAILEFGKRPISFLQMISQTEGFYIEHPPVVDKHDERIIFLCHRIYKEQNSWKNEYLFSFSIPAHLLMRPTDCLYESMLPLLPRWYGGSFYYLHAQEGEDLAVYKFDGATGHKIQCTPPGNYMAPLVSGNRVYYGGELKTDTASSTPPSMTANEYGLSIELPYLVL